MHRVARRCNFTVVSSAFHQFEPHGTTGVLVLAESHFSAHTYPENNKIYLDVFCCSPTFNAEKCSEIIVEEFAASGSTWHVISRP